MITRFDLPECCINCKNRDDEYNEWSGESSVYCTKNIWWPTRKQTCSKQEPYQLTASK